MGMQFKSCTPAGSPPYHLQDIRFPFRKKFFFASCRQAVDPEWDPYHEKRITLGGLVDRVDTIKRGRRIMFVACGTSYHACLACRQTMEELAELPVRLDTHFAQMHTPNLLA